MAAGSVVITSSDAAWAWTNTSGHNTITIEAIGGGGGGGGENGYPADGGGGKGGSYCRKKITKKAETTLNIVVGAAGTAGSGGNGGNGGASKVTQGATVVFLAPGGEGGKGATTDNHSGAGGQTECDGATNPATAIYGTLHFAGGNGAAGVYSTHYSGGGGGAAGPGGVGGAASGVTAGTGDAANFLNSTHYSGDGAAGKGTAESDGAAPASLNGGGGSGGNATDNTNHPGGAGKIGIVVISWVDSVNVGVSATCPSLTATTYKATVDVPVIATISGSATESITEADIVTGGKQIIITLTNDIWIPTGTYDPSTDNTVVEWLKADGSVLAKDTAIQCVDSDLVATWVKEKGYDAVAYGGYPTFHTNELNTTMPAIEFTEGSGGGLGISALDVDQPVVIWMVAKAVSASVNKYFFDGVTSRVAFLINQDTTWKWDLYAGGSETYTGTADTNWHIFYIVYNGASSVLTIDNGAPVTGLNPGTNPLTYMVLGRRIETIYGGVFIGEMIIHNAIPADPSIIRNYLNGRWGIY